MFYLLGCRRVVVSHIVFVLGIQPTSSVALLSFLFHQNRSSTLRHHGILRQAEAIHHRRTVRPVDVIIVMLLTRNQARSRQIRDPELRARRWI